MLWCGVHDPDQGGSGQGGEGMNLEELQRMKEEQERMKADTEAAEVSGALLSLESRCRLFAPCIVRALVP